MVALILWILFVVVLGIALLAVAVMPAGRVDRQPSTVWRRHRARRSQRRATGPIRSAAERGPRRGRLVLRRSRRTVATPRRAGTLAASRRAGAPATPTGASALATTSETRERSTAREQALVESQVVLQGRAAHEAAGTVHAAEPAGDLNRAQGPAPGRPGDAPTTAVARAETTGRGDAGPTNGDAPLRQAR